MNTIKPKRNYTPNAVPLSSDLAVNEFAINYADAMLYYKTPDGVIQAITLGGTFGGGSGGGGGGSFAWAEAPESFDSAGVAGQLAFDNGYIYVCVSANTWKRVPLESFAASIPENAILTENGDYLTTETGDSLATA